MTPEQIAQAELDMAAETIAEGDYHERHVVAATIRAIAPADVLAKVGDERCTKCGHRDNADCNAARVILNRGNTPGVEAADCGADEARTVQGAGPLGNPPASAGGRC